MLSKYGRPLIAVPLDRLVAWIHTTGITPNILTYVGFALTAVSAVILATGRFRMGGLVLLSAALFDMLDGTLARATHQSSTFGAFLDSTLDRYAESVTFLALVYYYSTTPNARTELILLFVIVVGSLMVSYTRARAEALNIACREGLLQRPERVIILVVGMVLGGMLPVLWILAVFTNFTAFQRIYQVYWRTRQSEMAPHPGQMINTGDKRPFER